MANIKTKLAVSIDLSKIDKGRIVSTDKNGNPFENGAKYYNFEIIVFEEKNEYGSDVMMTEGLSKEERDNKVKATIIGNGKTVYSSQGTAPQPPKPNQSMQSPPPPKPFFTCNGDQDLPF